MVLGGGLSGQQCIELLLVLFLCLVGNLGLGVNSVLINGCKLLGTKCMVQLSLLKEEIRLRVPIRTGNWLFVQCNAQVGLGPTASQQLVSAIFLAESDVLLSTANLRALPIWNE